MIALASDFDGTLFFTDGYHQEDIKKIKQLQQQGHLFGMCTGRPKYGLLTKMSKEIQLDFIISSSGAYIESKGQVLKETYLDRKTTKEMIALCEHQTIMAFQIDGSLYSLRQQISSTIDQTIIQDLDEVQGHIHGISTRCPIEEVPSVYEKIISNFPHINAFINGHFIDVVAKGVSKGEAVLFLKEHAHIDTMSCIGDAHNDLPMLEVADTSFTFHTSSQDIQQQTTHVVSSIAEAIDILIKEEKQKMV